MGGRVCEERDITTGLKAMSQPWLRCMTEAESGDFSLPLQRREGWVGARGQPLPETCRGMNISTAMYLPADPVLSSLSKKYPLQQALSLKM